MATDVQFKSVKISRGRQGWGGPLVITPTKERDKIVAVTGGGIPPIAYSDRRTHRRNGRRRLPRSAGRRAKWPA